MQTQSTNEISVHAWLSLGIEADASDLHLVAGRPPVLRVHGRLRELDAPSLEPEALDRLLTGLCPPSALARFQAGKNADFSLDLLLSGAPRRFRVNYFLSRQQIGACFRFVPTEIPGLAWAGFPEDIAGRLAGFRNGLVLISGVAGSGKTTTLAMLIDRINRSGGQRIITIEQPIEYEFPPADDSLVTQREVGVDVDSFADGLVAALRQDPNVLLVGEIRDRDTAQMALSAAETGHLVFSTLHTRDAKGAISRYADFFPQDVQTEIRSQLSLSLRAVISQHLLPSATDGEKRRLALEILFNNAPIASAIRLGKMSSIDNNILTGSADGMQTLDDSIRQLLRHGRITRSTAERYVSDPSRLA